MVELLPHSLHALKFVLSKKATKFSKISTLLLSTVHTDKSKVDISQNFLAFSEYMNFKKMETNSLSIYRDIQVVVHITRWVQIISQRVLSIHVFSQDLSSSAHRTPNFTNPQYFVSSLF